MRQQLPKTPLVDGPIGAAVIELDELLVAIDWTTVNFCSSASP
jgi:hypothetical protein